MSRSNASTLLFWILAADAATSAAAGLVLIIDADPLSVWLALPTELLRGAGLVMLAFAAFVAGLANRDSAPPKAVWAVIAVNAIWAVDSMILPFIGWVNPSALGLAFITAQAVGVAVFAELEYLALRKLSLSLAYAASPAAVSAAAGLPRS
jgi:hypothetical protein